MRIKGSGNIFCNFVTYINNIIDINKYHNCAELNPRSLKLPKKAFIIIMFYFCDLAVIQQLSQQGNVLFIIKNNDIHKDLEV